MPRAVKKNEKTKNMAMAARRACGLAVGSLKSMYRASVASMHRAAPMPSNDGMSSFRRPTLSMKSMNTVYQNWASAPQSPIIMRDVDAVKPSVWKSLGP